MRMNKSRTTHRTSGKIPFNLALNEERRAGTNGAMVLKLLCLKEEGLWPELAKSTGILKIRNN
jgi:hypothetical protein